MSPAPMLSIVLTVYNMESCLECCLDSILAQSFTDFEVLCINDGSRDASLSILESYAHRDKRIHVFSQKNKGVASARNLGIEKVSGKYLMILDSDDFFVNTFFEKMIGRAEKTNAEVVIGRACEYDQVSKKEQAAEWIMRKEYLPKKDVFSAREVKGCLFAAFMGWPWDKLYLTDYLKAQHLTFPLIENSEDLVFVYLALARAKRLSIVDEVLIKHRINRNASISNTREKFPRCFYDSLVILKNELRKDSDSYLDLKWGFLNWALHHTCWNIQTLPQGEARKSLVHSLFTSGFPELELEEHPPEYFALYKDLPYRYRELEAEYQGKHYHRSLWDKASVAFKSVEESGFLATCKRIIARNK